jgi:hypothetical protein
MPQSGVEVPPTHGHLHLTGRIEQARSRHAHRYLWSGLEGSCLSVTPQKSGMASFADRYPGRGGQGATTLGSGEIRSTDGTGPPRGAPNHLPHVGLARSRLGMVRVRHRYLAVQSHISLEPGNRANPPSCHRRLLRLRCTTPILRSGSLDTSAVPRERTEHDQVTALPRPGIRL